MKTKSFTIQSPQLLALATVLIFAQASSGYDQATVAAYGASTVEKSATAAPNNLVTVP